MKWIIKFFLLLIAFNLLFSYGITNSHAIFYQNKDQKRLKLAKDQNNSDSPVKIAYNNTWDLNSLFNLTYEFASVVEIEYGPNDNFYIYGAIKKFVAEPDYHYKETRGFVVKANKWGDIIWKTFLLEEEGIEDVIIDVFGNIIGVGTYSSLVKINSFGNISWHISYGTQRTLGRDCVFKFDSDGNVCLTHRSYEKLAFYKFNQRGTMIYNNTLLNREKGYEYIISDFEGYIYHYRESGNQLSVEKYSSGGFMIWRNSWKANSISLEWNGAYKGRDSIYLNCIINGNASLLKIGEEGYLEWNRTFGYYGKQRIAGCAIEASGDLCVLFYNRFRKDDYSIPEIAYSFCRYSPIGTLKTNITIPEKLSESFSFYRPLDISIRSIGVNSNEYIIDCSYANISGVYILQLETNSLGQSFIYFFVLVIALAFILSLVYFFNKKVRGRS